MLYNLEIMTHEARLKTNMVRGRPICIAYRIIKILLCLLIISTLDDNNKKKKTIVIDYDNRLWGILHCLHHVSM